MSAAVELVAVEKSFTMHLHGALRLPVIAGVTFSVVPGECVALVGPSGTGKSSVLKMIFGNYRCDGGRILVHTDDGVADVAEAGPRRILHLRRHTIGYVSQFLRAVPRVPTIDVVAEPLLSAHVSPATARQRAGDLLRRLNIPQHLWLLPPATFSGGEQQRINIARGLLPHYPILLLDEPTAALDAVNTKRVIELILQKKRAGVAIIMIVHDDAVRDRLADRIVDLTAFRAAG